MEIIIEEISHGHKLLSRQKFAPNNITIGRGYDNDIIISDPHVCPEHLQLHFNGEHWLVDDQGSIKSVLAILSPLVKAKYALFFLVILYLKVLPLVHSRA